VKTLLLAGLIALALLTAAPAAATEIFVPCPDGHSAVVVGTPTSCAFAHNVRQAWYGQPGNPVLAYSPVTDGIYSMYCAPYTATFSWGTIWSARRCTGGNNAAVVVW
jgi:hypothetical protein